MSKNEYGKQWNTPVLVLGCDIGALAILRTLGSLGVPVYGVEKNKNNPVLRSKYLKKYFIKKFDPENPIDYLECLQEVSAQIGKKAILIPTSDELSVFVAEYSSRLIENYIFPVNSTELLDQLADKKKMFQLALDNSIPTPRIICPQNMVDVNAALSELSFPIMLKGIDGQRLQAKTGIKMVIVETEDQLSENYKKLEDFDQPNLMLQEMIPGDDTEVYIFNGYFNVDSDCLAAFTGHKIRQFPIHIGCASLGECRWHDRVAEKTQRLMKSVGYKGILDIGYRLDPRDNKYKVLDINPRVGQAFRIFVAENNMDVIRSLYLDLTEQSQPEIKPIEGRRWIIEDYDLISTFNYFSEKSLTLKQWFSSLSGIQEGAWFCWKDPVPFFLKLALFSKRTSKAIWKRLYPVQMRLNQTKS